VTWAVHQGEIVLLHKDELSSHDNVVSGVVVQLVRLGSNAAVSVAVGGADRPPLYLSVPLQVVHAHGLEPGAEVSVAIAPAGIHLMPADRDEAQREAHRRMQPAQELVA
jgi:hypothetical protein